MSRNLVVWMVVLVAFALFGLWRVSGGRAGPARGESVTVAPVESAEGSGSVDLARPTPTETNEPAAVLESAPTDEPRAKRAAATPAAETISGRVVLPEGFVPSEQVWIMLRRGSEWVSSGVAMEPDGFFGLSVPAGMETVALSVGSRFLWLPREVLARPGQWDVELRPMAFGVIEGVVVPPASFAAVGASWDDVKLEWDPGRTASLSLEVLRRPSWRTEVSPDDGGAFELRWVTAGAGIFLHAENPFGPDWLEELAPLAPGEVRRVEIALEPGISVSGKVVDENGEPVAVVRLALGPEEPVGTSWNHWSEPDPMTDSEGQFLLTKVARDVTVVRTAELDLLRQGEASFDGRNGDVLDLVLRVVRGGRIEGTVRWPDGSPAERFDIEVLGALRRTLERSNGRFRLNGLPRGSHRVEVHATREGVTGRAEALDVETDGAPIELILEEAPACELRGSVVDGVDKPVERFWVHAYLAGRSASADGRGGIFQLSGLTPGSWLVTLRADGHQEVRQRVELTPRAIPDLRFVLLEAGRIRGRVVDGRGVPVAGAWVGEVTAAHTAMFSGPGDQATDANGAFDIEVNSAHLRLVAIANGYGPSEVLELDVEPGQAVEGLEFRLPEACRVEGSVLDEHGRPLSRAHVSPLESGLERFWAETDEQGAFALEGLPPGSMMLIAWHVDRPGALARTAVMLAPGRPSAAVLRFQAADPVRVRGRITRGGGPVACGLWFLSEGFGAECTADPDGSFEVVLQQPGEWRGGLWIDGERSSSDGRPADIRRFTVSVPDVEEHTLALEFDALPTVTSLDELWR